MKRSDMVKLIEKELLIRELVMASPQRLNNLQANRILNVIEDADMLPPFVNKYRIDKETGLLGPKPEQAYNIWEPEMNNQVEVENAWKELTKLQKEEHGEDVGIKFDQEKIRMELLPVRPLEDIADVLTTGAKKYSDNNWRKGFDWSRIYGSLQRHLSDWKKGIDLDPETAKKHLAHAGCCLMFLLEFSHSGAGKDDRIKYVDNYEKM